MTRIDDGVDWNVTVLWGRLWGWQLLWWWSRACRGNGGGLRACESCGVYGGGGLAQGLALALRDNRGLCTGCGSLCLESGDLR